MVDALMLNPRILYCYMVLSDKVKVNLCESKVGAVSTTGTKTRLNARPETCMRLRLSYIKILCYKQASTEGDKLLRSPFGHDEGFCTPVGPHDIVNYKVHKMKRWPRLYILAVHRMYTD
jgi:hypothetical protein